MGKTYIISDLHVTQGWDSKEKKYSRLEDFFFDDSFERFLRHLENEDNRRGNIKLIINGDFVCFQQVKNTPEDKSINGEIISLIEQKMGLGTTIEKTKWKLDRMFEGHEVLFTSLAKFLSKGNELFIIPGNHDIEFTYPELQSHFINKLDKLIPGQNITSQVKFNLWFYLDEDASLYIEHGNQYEQLNSFDYLLYPYLEHSDPKERSIFLPLGSFIVRYLLNELEEDFPFVDNVKPPQRLIYWFFINPRRWNKLPIYLKFLYRAFKKAHNIKKSWKKIIEPRHEKVLKDIAQKNNIEINKLNKLKKLWARSAITYRRDFFKELFKLKNLMRDYLMETVPDVHKIIGAKFIVFGHNHSVDYQVLTDKDGQEYYYSNSGTWTNILKLSFMERLSQSDNEFVVLGLSKKSEEEDYNLELYRWNDCLNTLDRVRLFKEEA